MLKRKILTGVCIALVIWGIIGAFLEGIGALGRVVCAAIIFFAMNLPPLTKDEKAGRYLVLAAILFIGGFIFGPPIGALALACIICVFVRDTA